MEYRLQCRFCLGGSPTVPGILATLQPAFPSGTYGSNGILLSQASMEAVIRFDPAAGAGLFDLTITAESDAACQALRDKILQELGAAVCQPNTYVVWVDYRFRGINLYSGDTFEPYKHAEFADCATAQWECRKLIESYIDDEARPGVTAGQIMETCQAEGIAPRIICEDPSCSTPDINEYALQRAQERAGDLWNEATVKRQDQFHTELIETSLTSTQIVDRIRALGEPRTFGGVTSAGGVYVILRLPDGASMRFRRRGAEGVVELMVAIPRVLQPPYRSAERRWTHAAALLHPQSATERALQTLRETAKEQET